MNTVTVERLAIRYGVLPSRVLAEASTFDLHAMDVGIRYEGYKEQVKNGTYKRSRPDLTPEQMAAMLKSTKGKNGKNKPR